MFKIGDKVIHAWWHPNLRPKTLDELAISSYGFDQLGIIVGIDRTNPYDSSKYWNVKIDCGIVQWKESLMLFMN